MTNKELLKIIRYDQRIESLKNSGRWAEAMQTVMERSLYEYEVSVMNK